MGLTAREKALYQQIHPGKLATDWATTFIGTFLLWQHELLAGLAVAIVPAVSATALVISFADLERAKASPFGRYGREYIPRSMHAVRAFGAVVFLAGSRFQILWAMEPSVIVILVGWLRGILRRGAGAEGLKREPKTASRTGGYARHQSASGLQSDNVERLADDLSESKGPAARLGSHPRRGLGANKRSLHHVPTCQEEGLIGGRHHSR